MKLAEIVKFYEEKKALQSLRYEIRGGYKEGSISEIDTKIREMEVIESKFDHVKISFMIGYRSYYYRVVKVGKYYFDRGEKMLKKNGICCIKEIPEITEQMSLEMYQDSMYY